MRRVTLRNARIAITLIAVIVIIWPRLLPRWIFAIGITDTSSTRLAVGITVVATVTTRIADTIRVIRSRYIGPVRSVISGGFILPNSSTSCTVWWCCSSSKCV